MTISLIDLPAEAIVRVGSHLSPSHGLSFVSTCQTLWECKPQIEHLFRHRIRLATREFFLKASQAFTTSFEDAQADVEAYIYALTLGSVSKIQRGVTRILFGALIRLNNEDLARCKAPVPRFFVQYFKGETLELIHILKEVLSANRAGSIDHRNHYLMKMSCSYVKVQRLQNHETRVERLNRALELAALVKEEVPGQHARAFKGILLDETETYFLQAKKQLITPLEQFSLAISKNISRLTLNNAETTLHTTQALLFRSLLHLQRSDLKKVTKMLPEFMTVAFFGDTALILYVLDRMKESHALDAEKKYRALLKLSEYLFHKRRYVWACEVVHLVPEDFAMQYWAEKKQTSSEH